MNADEPQRADELLPVLYDELRRLAAAQMARLPPGQTLQPTALVHEAYLKLAGGADPGWSGRGHFFGAAAQAMREIIVDHARRRAAKKRGGGSARVPLDAALEPAADAMPMDEVLAVDRELDVLAKEHPRTAQVVVLRYFGGLTVDEIAETLGLTTRTIEREWRFARAMLARALGRRDGEP